MQFGFRSNHSTDTALCYFVEELKSKLDNGGVVGAIFLDLKKAFDAINHNVLVSKLSTHNISADTIKGFTSYLMGRKNCTRINDKLSTENTCSIGVPQGSILGPLLFSIYINNLPSICQGINIQMYADDTIIYVHAKTKQQEIDI